MLSGLIIYKLVALKLGASTLGILGQFVSFLSIIIILSTAGIGQGITKLVSENRENSVFLTKILSTAFIVMLIAIFLIIISLYTFSNYIFSTLFYIDDVHVMFKYLFCLFIVFISFSQFMSSIILGLKEIKIYSISVSFNSLLSIFLSYVLINYYGLYGAFFSLFVGYLFEFSILFLYFIRNNLYTLVTIQCSKDILIKYFNYALMFIFSAFLIPSVQIIVRKMIGNNYSLVDIGYWEALVKISSIYISFISVFLSAYYFPHLSDKKDDQIVAEVIKFLKVLTPVLIIMFLFIYIFNDIIIKVLFTDEFLIIKDYLMIQQIGDFFRILSFLIGYITIVKMWTKIYIVFEIFHSFLFIAITYFFISILNGFYAASIAYSITYFIHFIINCIIFYKFRKKVMN